MIENGFGGVASAGGRWWSEDGNDCENGREMNNQVAVAEASGHEKM